MNVNELNNNYLNRFLDTLSRDYKVIFLVGDFAILTC